MTKQVCNAKDIEDRATLVELIWASVKCLKSRDLRYLAGLSCIFGSSLPRTTFHAPRRTLLACDHYRRRGDNPPNLGKLFVVFEYACVSRREEIELTPCYTHQLARQPSWILEVRTKSTSDHFYFFDLPGSLGSCQTEAIYFCSFS
jgi:hypothetical protein